MRVIVVDDSAPVRSRVAALLREAGLDVVGEAPTAQAALCLVHSLRPDAVVLDLQLPDRNGMEILVELKANEPAPVVAILTNTAEEACRTRCLALGADYFFDKSRGFDAVAPALVAHAPKR